MGHGKLRSESPVLLFWRFSGISRISKVSWVSRQRSCLKRLLFQMTPFSNPNSDITNNLKWWFWSLFWCVFFQPQEAHKHLTCRQFLGHPGHRSSGRRCFMFLGFHTQHINVRPLATQTVDPPPPPRLSPETIVYVLFRQCFCCCGFLWWFLSVVCLFLGGGQTCNNQRATSVCPIIFIIFSSLLFSLS